jgi:hypothetical protein
VNWQEYLVVHSVPPQGYERLRLTFVRAVSAPNMNGAGQAVVSSSITVIVVVVVVLLWLCRGCAFKEVENGAGAASMSITSQGMEDSSTSPHASIVYMQPTAQVLSVMQHLRTA